MSSRIQYEAWLMPAQPGHRRFGSCWPMITLRVFRLVIRHGPFWTGWRIFCVGFILGAGNFILLYEQNDGMFRAYVIGGNFRG